jgi:hypothetical protein
MKTLFASLSSLMIVKVLKTHSQEAISELVYYVCNFLDFHPSSIEIDDLHVKSVNGMCIDLSQNDFLILLKDHRDMMYTLVHELVHVNQYIKQDLGKHLDARSEKYENCWWEVEAKKLTKQIMENFNERNGTTE